MALRLLIGLEMAALSRSLKHLTMGLLVALLFFASLEGIALLAGLLTGNNWRVPPPLPEVPQYTAMCRAGEDLYRLCPAGGNTELSRRTPFSKEPTKPRIIVIGESFVYGLGLKDEEAWPARLGHYMGDNYEVLNFGRCGSESASLSRIVQAAVELKPTAIVFAMGNNEYTMAPYYSGLAGRHPLAFQRIAEQLSRLQLYGLLYRQVAKRAPNMLAQRLTSFANHPMQREIEALHGRPADTSIFTQQLADPDVTEMLEDTKRLSERFYKLRLAGMVRYAQTQGIEVVMATLPRSLTSSPLLSGLHGVERSDVQDLIAHVQEYELRYNEPLSSAQLAPYHASIEQLLELDDKLSYAQFMKARALMKQGKRDLAIEAYQRSSDWDLVPDVTPHINEIIRELADNYDTHLVELPPLANVKMERPADFFIDTIHVNAQGADEIGAHVASELNKVL